MPSLIIATLKNCIGYWIQDFSFLDIIMKNQFMLKSNKIMDKIFLVHL